MIQIHLQRQNIQNCMYKEVVCTYIKCLFLKGKVEQFYKSSTNKCYCISKLQFNGNQFTLKWAQSKLQTRKQFQ